MYRVHDAPDPDKVEELRGFLKETGLPGLALARGQAIKPELFNRVLRRAAVALSRSQRDKVFTDTRIHRAPIVRRLLTAIKGMNAVIADITASRLCEFAFLFKRRS